MLTVQPKPTHRLLQTAGLLSDSTCCLRNVAQHVPAACSHLHQMRTWEQDTAASAGSTLLRAGSVTQLKAVLVMHLRAVQVADLSGQLGGRSMGTKTSPHAGQSQTSCRQQAAGIEPVG